MRTLVVLAAMVTAIAAAAVTITVDPGAPLAEVGPVPSAMVGFNLAVHTRPETVASAAITPPGTNGVWEALRPINPGLIRQWINAPECGLHGLDLPRTAPDDGANFLAWLRGQLAPDSEHWAEFNLYLRGIAALGDDVQLMLNEPTPPVWLGPFRWHDRHAGELVDLRSGEVVDYQRFVDWCGLDGNRIGDLDRFERLRNRFALYFELLVAHVLADPVLSQHVTSITLGNETDSGGEFGLVLNRDDGIWRTGAYFALMLTREHIVGGQPLRCRIETPDDGACPIETLAVRHDDGRIAALLCNLSDQTIPVRLDIPGDGPMRLLSIELPLAHERNDYRNVTDDEIETGLAPAGVHDPSITLAPHGVVFAVRGE